MTLVLLFLFLSIFSPNGFSQDHDEKTIYWTRWDAPPIYLLEGPYKGEGIQDLIELSLRKRLKQYKHKVIVANVLRVIKLAEKKTNTCNAGWLNTSNWRKVFYFSKPITVTQANGVIIKARKIHKITSIKPLSLQSILDQTSLNLGIGKLYGEGIDEVLQKNIAKYPDKIHRVSNAINTYRMLLADRIDYTIGYPVEASYYQTILNGREKFVYVPLADNTPLVEVVAACSNSPWGKKVIKEIDMILKDPEVRKEINGHLKWWGDMVSVKKK